MWLGGGLGTENSESSAGGSNVQQSLRSSVLNKAHGNLPILVIMLSVALLPVLPLPIHPFLSFSGPNIQTMVDFILSVFPTSEEQNVVQYGKCRLKQPGLGKNKQSVLGGDLNGRLIETNGRLPRELSQQNSPPRLGPIRALKIAIHPPEAWQQITAKQSQEGIFPSQHAEWHTWSKCKRDPQWQSKDKKSFLQTINTTKELRSEWMVMMVMMINDDLQIIYTLFVPGTAVSVLKVLTRNLFSNPVGLTLVLSLFYMWGVRHGEVK